MNISAYLSLEEKLLREQAIALLEEHPLLGDMNDKEVERVNNILDDELAERTHSEFIFLLCVIYCRLTSKDTARYLFAGETRLPYEVVPQSINPVEIPRICEELHIAYLNSKFEFKKGKFVRTKSKANLIETGSVYTDLRITETIVCNTLASIKSIPEDWRILDFACGTGRFYETIVKVLKNQYNVSVYDCVTKHIHAIDIDPVALNITRLKALSCLESPSAEQLDCISKNIILKNGLLYENTLFPNAKALSGEDLEGRFRGKYDAIVSNPPYLVLKPNKNKVGDLVAQNISEQVAYFRHCGHYTYSIEGMLNLYQLSIEAMVGMLAPRGQLGVICPSTLFADVSAARLRKFLLLKNTLQEIRYFSEDDQLFENVTQATCIFQLQKGGCTSSIKVHQNGEDFEIQRVLIEKLFTENMEIPSISKTEWGILEKLAPVGKLKNLQGVRNRRGELDLTLLKQYITTSPSPYRLVRGNMIGDHGIKDVNNEYVLSDFMKVKSEDYMKNDFNHRRLVCQQVSNMGCVRRLRFVFCEASDILGNSCNYISGDPETLGKLYLVLNSSVMNWRFKITSSNNHINNYELDELPIIDLSEIDLSFQYSSQEELDNYIGMKYGLRQDEITYISARQ